MNQLISFVLFSLSPVPLILVRNGFFGFLVDRLGSGVTLVIVLTLAAVYYYFRSKRDARDDIAKQPPPAQDVKEEVPPTLDAGKDDTPNRE